MKTFFLCVLCLSFGFAQTTESSEPAFFEEIQHLRTIGVGDSRISAISPDGNTLVTWGSGGLISWDIPTGNQNARIGSYLESGSVFFRTNDMVYTIHSTSQQSRKYTVHINSFDATTLAKLESHTHRTNSRPYYRSNSGTNFVALDIGRRTLALWDLSQQKKVRSAIRMEGLFEVEFYGDKVLLSDGSKGLVTLWDTSWRWQTFGHGRKLQEFDITSVIEDWKNFDKDNIYNDYDYIYNLDFVPEKNLVTMEITRRVVADQGSQDKKELQVWDVETGQMLHTLDTSEMFYLQPSPDGKHVVFWKGDGVLRFFDLETFQLTDLEVDLAQRMFHAEFTLDGKKLIRRSSALSLHMTIDVWDTENYEFQYQQIFTEYFNNLTALAISDDNLMLAIGNDDSTVQVRDFETGEIISQLDLDLRGNSRKITNLNFSPDNRYLALTSRGAGEITLLDPLDGSVVKIFEGHDRGMYSINSVNFNDDGSLLISAGRYDETVKVWDVETGQMIESYEVNDSPTRAFFLPDESKIIVEKMDHPLSFLSGPRSLIVERINRTSAEQNYYELNIDNWYYHEPQRNDFFTSSHRGELYVHNSVINVEANETIGYVILHPSRRIVFSPDDCLIVGESQGKFSLWDLSAAYAEQSVDTNFRPFTLDESRQNMAVFSNDGRYIVTASEGNIINIWGTPDERPVFNQGCE